MDEIGNAGTLGGGGKRKRASGRGRSGETAETRSLGPVPPAGARKVSPPTPTLSLDCGGGVTMELVLIPAGEFMMGSPASEAQRGSDETRHRVRITKPFFVGKCQVTQAQYQTVTGANPSNFKGPDLPVEQVSWDDATEFCRQLSRRTGREVRLPTEAEWEYACRAGTTTPFHFGETISTDQANYDGNYPYAGGVKGTYRDETTPVGSFPANAWGLHDMHGNVCEWCADWYDEGHHAKSPADDPSGPTSGRYRVLRGGSWDGDGDGCRSAYRDGGHPTDRSTDSGFRVAAAAPGR